MSDQSPQQMPSYEALLDVGIEVTERHGCMRIHIPGLGFGCLLVFLIPTPLLGLTIFVVMWAFSAPLNMSLLISLGVTV